MPLQTFSQNKNEKKIEYCTQAALEARVDFDFFRKINNFKENKNRAGFKGQYLNFKLDGNLSENVSYHYRQRINDGNMGFSKTFFQGTDYLYLRWNVSDNFSFTAGKEIVAIGGWEYDLAPIDMYIWSKFWNNVNCYEVGVSAHYCSDDGNQHLQLQISNSPHVKYALQSMFAYNLIWYGRFGAWKPIYSINILEYERGSYINYIALGNKFDFDKFYFYLDLMSRTTDKQKFLGDCDYSMMFEVRLIPNKKWNIFFKSTYDCNQAHTPYGVNLVFGDYYVQPGMDYFRGGLGCEFYPVTGKNQISLHAFTAIQSSDDGNHFDLQANIGLTWRLFIK